MRCASSVILTAINTLRNPDGIEKNWSYPIEYVSIFNRHGLQTAKLREVQLLKSVIGQVASLIIVPIAIVETISYTALTVVSLVFYRYTHMPYAFSMSLLKSSSFTIVWVFSKIEYYWLISIGEGPLDWFQSNQARQHRLVFLLVINAIIATTSFFFGKHMLRNEPTHESFAREKINPSWFFRDEDKVEIIRQYLPSATENFIQHCLRNGIIWRGLMRSINILPSELENHLRNLDRRYRRGPVIAAVLNEDEEQDDENYMYICAIKLEPLIDPVQDPTATGTNPVLYEREAIIRWLGTHSISPFTRHPLISSELLEIDQMLSEVRAGIKEQQERIARKREERRANRVEIA